MGNNQINIEQNDDQNVENQLIDLVNMIIANQPNNVK